MNCFNVVLHAKHVYFKTTQATVLVEQPQTQTVFFSEQFERIMAKYKHRGLAYQMNLALVNHAAHHLNTYTFHLYWSDSQKHIHPLRVTLERGVPFADVHSSFLTEQNLLDIVPAYKNAKVNSGQLYYTLKVDQLLDRQGGKTNDPISNIFSMWMTLDGLIGELTNITPGTGLSGNEVLSIYQYFARQLQVDNIFICDNSVLKGNERHVNIPLRLLKALASGKTWFEQRLPGIQLFDHPNIPISENNTVTQNNKIRTQALKELQILPLSTWHAKLDGTRQKMLLDLYQKYFPNKDRRGKSKDDAFDNQTVQSLAAAICQDARTHGEVIDELEKFTQILCGNIRLNFGNIPLDAKARDIWVQTRVHQLMWGSYIWQQKSLPTSAKESVHRPLP